MSEHHFGLHKGHLSRVADEIAERHDATHTNYTEPNGEQRGWFCCPNLGSPFDRATERAVLAALEAAGGFDALRVTDADD